MHKRKKQKNEISTSGSITMRAVFKSGLGRAFLNCESSSSFLFDFFNALSLPRQPVEHHPVEQFKDNS